MAQADIKQHSFEQKTFVDMFSKLCLFVFIILIAISIATTFVVSHKNTSISSLEEDISRLTSDVTKLQKEQVAAVLNAKNAVDGLESKKIMWSEVLTLLLDATPDDIVFRSFSGNENASLNMSAVASSFDRVADLIDSLGKKPFVRNVFVPSIVKGTTPTNAAVYSFSLNIEYEK